MTNIELINMVCCVLSNTCALEINSNGRCKQEHVNFTLHPIKTLHFHIILPLYYHSPVATIAGRVVNYHWGALADKVTWHLICCSSEITWQTKNISSAIVSMTARLVGMVTYLERLLRVKPHHPLVSWSCEITWKIESIVSQLLQCLWPPKMAWWWFTLSNSHM